MTNELQHRCLEVEDMAESRVCVVLNAFREIFFVCVEDMSAGDDESGVLVSAMHTIRCVLAAADSCALDENCIIVCV